MFRKSTTIVVLLSLLLLANYASATKMKSTWKNPKATPAHLQFKKVLVVATINHEFTRKIAEDTAVQILQSGGAVQAVPSYTILGTEDLTDKEAAKAKIAGQNFDGAIVMRYAGEKDDRKYDTAGTDYGSGGFGDPFSDFWGYYYSGWGAIYNATTDNDTTIYIETLFYSLKDNMAVWAGITANKNPKNPADVVAGIAEETSKYLIKEGLIPKKKK